MPVPAASRAVPLGSDRADTARCTGDAPCGAYPCDRVQSAHRTRMGNFPKGTLAFLPTRPILRHFR
eukprot:7965687-Pyramimonas_sp.AAC.1